MSIHQRIRVARQLLNLSEQEFADRVGVTRAAVQHWERDGGTAPSRRNLPVVASSLGITVSELVSDDSTSSIECEASSHVGQKIRQLMKQRGIGNQRMAVACGVTVGAVSNWFASGRISKKSLVSAAALLEVDVGSLLAGDAKLSAQPMAAQTLSPMATELGSLLDLLTDKIDRARALQESSAVILRIYDERTGREIQ